MNLFMRVAFAFHLMLMFSAVLAESGFGRFDDSALPFPQKASGVIRIMAANTTSGNYQAYEDPGIRIFQGLDPDIVLVQEFNYRDGTLADLVDIAFGPEFDFYVEPGNEQIPNGIVSRYPIVAAGEWEDTLVSNRDYAWARIDLPDTDRDLWAVSVHWLTDDSKRTPEANELVAYVKANVPTGDYLVIGGDFNTDTHNETSLSILDEVVDTSGPYPADNLGDPDTNAGRTKPYDGVYVDTDLQANEVAVAIDTQSFFDGLVFDSRVFEPLSAVSPVQEGDSGASQMQHMAVVRDFAFDSDPTDPCAVTAISPPDGMLPLLYEVRDRMLSKLPEGQWLIDTYYRHSQEVARTLLADDRLRIQALILLYRLRPTLENAVSGQALAVDAVTVGEIKSFAENLRRVASPGLAADIDRFLTEVVDR